MKLNFFLIFLLFKLNVNGEQLIKSIFYYDQNNKLTTEENFNAYNVPLKIIIHGWQDMKSEADAPGWATDLKNAIYKNDNKPKQVMVVNWNSVSDQIVYVSSAFNVPSVADELVQKLKKINANNIHCIGHSLGAHVCGFAGKKSNVRFNRISGLDPAGPNFETKNLFTKTAGYERLDKSDAEYVDIYHTNNGHLGISFNIGHADFYVNDNGIQPGCNNWDLTRTEACSHQRSVDYFTESVKNRQCSTPYKRDGTRYDTSFGYFSEKREGEFILPTHKSEPYCCDSQYVSAGWFTAAKTYCK